MTQQHHIEQLIDAETIGRRVAEMAREVSAAFDHEEVTLCAVMTGSLVFTADLVRLMDCPTRIVTVEAASYRDGTESGELSVYGLVEHKVRDHRVLLVDDIFDTGRTMAELVRRVEDLGPREVKRCALLRKLHDRVEGTPPEFIGFDVPDVFVVGYGLDLDGRYRGLPYIGKVNPYVL